MRELNRILSSFLKIKIKGQTYYIYQNPSWDLLQEGDEIYDEILKNTRFDSLINEKDVSNICIERGLLEANYERRVRSAMKLIETYQIRLYQDRSSPIELKKTRERLQGIRKSLEEVNSILFNYKIKTREHLAETAREDFILLSCLYDEDYNLVEDFEDVNSLRFEYYNKIPSIQKIREIARSEPWRTIWSTKKGAAFRNDPLSITQTNLARYSKFYDNIFKHHKCPDNSVVNDDDMLDGWLLLESKDDKEKEKISSKVNRHKEVFVMVDNREQAEEVFYANNPQARMKMKQRQSEINRRGSASHTQLTDFKLDMLGKNENKRTR